MLITQNQGRGRLCMRFGRYNKVTAQVRRDRSTARWEGGIEMEQGKVRAAEAGIRNAFEIDFNHSLQGTSENTRAISSNLDITPSKPFGYLALEKRALSFDSQNSDSMSSSTSAPITSTRPVWLVTGASSGLGLEVAIEAAKLATVVAIGRDHHGLELAANAGCRTVELDLRASAEHISSVIADIIKTAGRVDVLVNAAGYILEGAVEETSDAELEDIFLTNVFAPIRLARTVLPHMRRTGAGVIFNVAGIGGFSGSPNAGAYCSSKAALATFTEALQRETGPLGIRVCLVQLGHFRTAFLKAGHRLHTALRIVDYDPVLDPLRKAFNGLDGHQPGDPGKAARALVHIASLGADSIPTLLALGSDVVPAELSAHEAKRQAFLAHDTWTNSMGFDA